MVISKTNILNTLTIIMLLTGTVFTSTVSAFVNNQGFQKTGIRTIVFYQNFSKPELEPDENGEYLYVKINETNTYTTQQGYPMLPFYVKKLELHWNTKIHSVQCKFYNMKKTVINKKIEPVLTIKRHDEQMVAVRETSDIYNNSGLYPEKWLTYSVTAGINNKQRHTLFLSIKIFPIRYNPLVGEITYINQVKVTVELEETDPTREAKIIGEKYDLLIITPADFKKPLLRLAEHKNKHGVSTKLVTLNEIFTGKYFETTGRDKPEQIKYFIKDAVENWGVTYVLLIGDVTKTPVRFTEAYPWGEHYGGNILTDLYYADLYDENHSFCSWDSNDNNVFGEVNYSGFPPRGKEVDKVDLSPDVLIGRLPCSNNEEVNIVVDKIITYEKNTCNQIWFNKIVLAGGDTFPISKGGLPFIYEGEITNVKVAQQLPGFKHIKLWSSKHNLNALFFNIAISHGAGFVSYSGHGFEHGWGTYRPNAIRRKMGLLQPVYLSPYIKFLHNKNMFPIIFFDACLTAKLDYNMTDLKRYFPFFAKTLSLFSDLEINPREYLPCFAWCFVKQNKTGAIATIGSTRPAYTLVDEKDVYGGAGYLNVHFFKSYKEGVSLGEMFRQAQEDYLNYVGKDFFTLEEFTLIGDPSLRVGGYPR